MNGRYNTKSPAVKRLMREAQELSEPTDQYFAQPLDDNLFEWHFTIRGPADSDFQNGIYHGRIILPVDYPMKPPSIIWLTPNGRFETNKKICLSISGHHPESWQPSWSIRTALLAIIGFMPTHPGGAIGSLDYTPEEHKLLAKKSKDWKCTTCGEITGILLDASASTQATSNEAKELAAQINLQGEKPKCKDGECPVEQARLAEMQSKTTTTTTTTSSNAAPENKTSQPANETTVSQVETTATSTVNNNAPCENIQQGTPISTSSLPSPVPPQSPVINQQFSQFPQWPPMPNAFPMATAFPMPPMGFPPFQYPGIPPPPPMPPMQFPYPPSHYPAMPPQYSWSPNAMGVGMYPGGSFHPPPPSIPSTPPTVANSSINNINGSQENNSAIDPDRSSNMNGQYSRTPMTCPVITRRTHPSSAGGSSNSAANEENSDNVEESENIDKSKVTRGDVFKELLFKVKRTGSGPEVSDDQNPTASETGTENQQQSHQARAGVPGVSVKVKRYEDAGNQNNIDEKAVKNTGKELLEEGTDSEVSTKPGKTTGGGGQSISEAGDTNTEDNSVSDVPPIEKDQNPGLEKGACSSASQIEKRKQKSSTTKGLRHRQSESATSNVPTDVRDEGVPAEPERSEGGNLTRQRIEAVVGDTSLRNRSRHAARLANLANRPTENETQDRQRSFDFGFYLMLGLFTTSMVILFNRLAAIGWSDS